MTFAAEFSQGKREVSVRKRLTIQNAKIDTRKLPSTSSAASIGAVFVGPRLQMDG